MKQVKIKFFGKKIPKSNLRREIIVFYEKMSEIFKADIEIIMIYFFDSRNSYEKLVGRSTDKWEVGSATKNNTINIFSPYIFESESTHKKEDFLFVLKHELVHLFLNKVTGIKTLPLWLEEGLCGYFSEQYKFAKIRNKNPLKKDFCKKIGTLEEWNNYVNYGAYSSAYLFTAFLIENFTFNKIMTLIKSLSGSYNYVNFQSMFKKVLGKTIRSVELNFLESL